MPSTTPKTTAATTKPAVDQLALRIETASVPRCSTNRSSSSSATNTATRATHAASVTSISRPPCSWLPRRDPPQLPSLPLRSVAPESKRCLLAHCDRRRAHASSLRDGRRGRRARPRGPGRSPHARRGARDRRRAPSRPWSSVIPEVDPRLCRPCTQWAREDSILRPTYNESAALTAALLSRVRNTSSLGGPRLVGRDAHSVVAPGRRARLGVGGD